MFSFWRHQRRNSRSSPLPFHRFVFSLFRVNKNKQNHIVHMIGLTLDECSLHQVSSFAPERKSRTNQHHYTLTLTQPFLPFEESFVPNILSCVILFHMLPFKPTWTLHIMAIVFVLETVRENGQSLTVSFSVPTSRQLASHLTCIYAFTPCNNETTNTLVLRN